MNEEELVSYVVRYCKHELSEEEYRFLQRWLEEKQENRQTFREWVRTYRQGRKVGCWDGIQEEQAWEQISCRLSASPRKRRRLWKEWWKQVAILTFYWVADYCIIRSNSYRKVGRPLCLRSFRVAERRCCVCRMGGKLHWKKRLPAY